MKCSFFGGFGIKFFQDREFVVADENASEGSYYIDGYAPESQYA